MSLATPSICASCQTAAANVGGKPGALMECASCHLVNYCGKACQTSHWPEHKQDCKSDLMKTTWQPRWVREGRRAAFVGDNIPSLVPFGRNKYFWGNMPALDVLRLVSHEGGAYQKPLSLLFAASGDLRNVVKTVASVPTTYCNQLKIDLNDRDMDVVARNIIFLLLSYTAEDCDDADTVDCILHVWYSALILQSCLDRLSAVRHLVEEVCSKISGRPLNAMQAKTWTFPNRKGSIRVILTTEKWRGLLSYLEVPSDLTAQHAQKIRSAVVNSPQRVDYVDRGLFTKLKPQWRLCFQKFRQDGILVPFGESRRDFTVPNPTFFQNADEWPMKDSADPLEGWSITDVFATHSSARDDLNGKMSAYIRSVLAAFHERTKSLHLDFQLFQGDVHQVVPMLSGKYDRIEVSNICDAGYVGSRHTLALFGPLLQSLAENSHATLVMLYLNAVAEERSRKGPGHEMQTVAKEMKKVSNYLSTGPRDQDKPGPEFLRFLAARDLVRDGDKYFDSYVRSERLEDFGRAAGVQMKVENTIVEAWPLRLKLRPGQKGAQDEFELLLGSGHSGLERYLEWKKLS